MSKKPLFSVIIPALNEEKFLPKLLASLAAQTQKNFEVIVVDGKSRDGTVAIAKGFARKVPGLSVIVSKKASLPLQRNLGAQVASGRWFAFMDADIVCMPYLIDRMEWYIRTESPSVFTTWFQPDSNIVSDAFFTLLANLVLEGSLFIKRPITPGPLTAIRSDVFTSIGGYDESHAFNEDVEFGLRLLKKGFYQTLLRETLYIWSMRRIRNEGKMKYVNQMIVASLPVLFMKQPLKHMPGYIMGGHLYQKKKPIKRSALRRYERKLKQLTKELFA